MNYYSIPDLSFSSLHAPFEMRRRAKELDEEEEKEEAHCGAKQVSQRASRVIMDATQHNTTPGVFFFFFLLFSSSSRLNTLSSAQRSIDRTNESLLFKRQFWLNTTSPLFGGHK